MSFELQDQGDGWRLRAGLLANGGEGFRPHPPPSTAVERVLAIYLHLGIDPEVLRFLSVTDPDEKERSLTPASLARWLPAVIGGGLIPWAVYYDGSQAIALIAVYFALVCIYLTMRSLAKHQAMELLPVVLTSTHLLVLSGDGSHIRIRTELPASAITHATVDDRAGPKKPVTITFHGPHGPVCSVRSPTMSLHLAAFSLHQAQVPLVSQPQPGRHGGGPPTDEAPQ